MTKILQIYYEYLKIWYEYLKKYPHPQTGHIGRASAPGSRLDLSAEGDAPCRTWSALSLTRLSVKFSNIHATC